MDKATAKQLPGASSSKSGAESTAGSRPRKEASKKTDFVGQGALGDYDLISKIGEGTYGLVYLARWATRTGSSQEYC